MTISWQKDQFPIYNLQLSFDGAPDKFIFRLNIKI